MKPELLLERLAPVLPKLCCPKCGKVLHAKSGSVVCEEGHCYDASRKGYINFAPDHNQQAEKYTANLFESRGLVFRCGFYQPILQAIQSILAEHFGNAECLVLDAGCGEGYYARSLKQAFPHMDVIGLDLSRDAIQLAARDDKDVCWLTADLTHMPVGDGCADCVLDVLTPGDYAAFARVLKPDGFFIKVIPGTDYLKEVRLAVANHLRNGGSYDNSRVVEHLESRCDVLSRQTIRFTRDLTPEQSRAFLHMTPMTFSVPEDALEKMQLDEITIDMQILVCKCSK